MDRLSWLALRPLSLLIATSTLLMLLPTPCWIRPRFKNEFGRCASLSPCPRRRLLARSDVRRAARRVICAEWPYCRSGKGHQWRHRCSRRPKPNCGERDVSSLRWTPHGPWSEQSIFISGAVLRLQGAFRIFSGWSCSSTRGGFRATSTNLDSHFSQKRREVARPRGRLFHFHAFFPGRLLIASCPSASAAG